VLVKLLCNVLTIAQSIVLKADTRQSRSAVPTHAKQSML